MRRHILALTLLLAMTSIATAQSTRLAPELSGISFLVGTWVDGSGNVAETGGKSRGSSSIVPEVGGSVLLRRDHTELLGSNGKPTGSSIK